MRVVSLVSLLAACDQRCSGEPITYKGEKVQVTYDTVTVCDRTYPLQRGGKVRVFVTEQVCSDTYEQPHAFVVQDGPVADITPLAALEKERKYDRIEPRIPPDGSRVALLLIYDRKTDQTTKEVTTTAHAYIVTPCEGDFASGIVQEFAWGSIDDRFAPKDDILAMLDFSLPKNDPHHQWRFEFVRKYNCDTYPDNWRCELGFSKEGMHTKWKDDGPREEQGSYTVYDNIPMSLCRE